MTNCYCDDNSPEFYSVRTVTARKPHRCDECRKVAIAPGEKYEYVSGLWDGNFNYFKTCHACKDLATWVAFNVPCVCLAHGEMIERCKEAVIEARDRAPDETRGLYFEFLRRLYKIKRAAA